MREHPSLKRIPEGDDPNVLPVGSILPFTDAVDIPANWEILDGRSLDVELVPTLAMVMGAARPEALEIWRRMGGDITDESIKLPNLRDRQAYEAAFGFIVDGAQAVLAIKAHRDVSSDASGSQVHGDDSAQGQPGQ